MVRASIGYRRLDVSGDVELIDALSNRVHHACGCLAGGCCQCNAIAGILRHQDREYPNHRRCFAATGATGNNAEGLTSGSDDGCHLILVDVYLLRKQQPRQWL